MEEHIWTSCFSFCLFRSFNYRSILHVDSNQTKQKMKKIDQRLDRVLRTGSMAPKEGKILSISKYF